MSAELKAVGSQLRKEIEALELERREGDEVYAAKMQTLTDSRARIAAARGDGDKLTLLKDEMKAKALARSVVVLNDLKAKNAELLNLLHNQLVTLKAELRQVHDDKKGQQEIFLALRDRGVAEFQNFSPMSISDLSEDDEAQLDKQFSFSNLSNKNGASGSPPGDADVALVTEAPPFEDDAAHVAVAGETPVDDMYSEPIAAAEAA